MSNSSSRPGVLVTSARMPFAVEEIRKLGEAGLRVHAVDTFDTAPGRHSRQVEASHTVPSPRSEPHKFVARLAEIARAHELELLIPCFEDIFYAAKLRDELAGSVELFAPSFATLERLHDKVRFIELAEEIGLSVPEGRVVQSREELAEATEHFEAFFARPAFSRGGLELFTNQGELAGELELEDCSPTAKNPWLVQDFVEGEDLCTFSVAREGRLVAHVNYVHHNTIEGAGGILFESVEAPEALRACQALVEATNFHGQLAVDFMGTKQGLVPIECNPRATNGVGLMDGSTFVDAVFGRLDGLKLTPAGRRRKIAAALVRQMVLDWSSIPDNLRALAEGGPDIYGPAEDKLPGLFQVLSYSHVLRYKLFGDGDERSSLMAAYFDDICWNGEPIE